MEFRSPEDKAAFNDYAYELICLNEVDTSKYTFHDKKTRDFFLYVESAFQSGAKDMPEELKEMDVEVAYIAAFFTGTLGIAQEAIRESVRTGKEHVNMCEAVRRTLNETRIEGKTEGFAEGKTEGFAEGKTEGFAEGKAEGEMEIILSMFRNGIPFERVQAVVGQKVTEEELRAFEKEAHSQKLNQ